MQRTLNVTIQACIAVLLIGFSQLGTGTCVYAEDALLQIPNENPQIGAPDEKSEFPLKQVSLEREDVQIAKDDEKVSQQKQERLLKQGKEVVDPLEPWQAAVLRNNAGNQLEDQGDWKRAREAYEEAIRLAPDSPLAYSNLGNLYTKQGKFKEAISLYKQALRIDPTATFAHINLGNIYYELKDWSRAIREYKITLVLDPESSVSHNNLGDTYLQKNLPNYAMRHLKQAIQLDPTFASAHDNLGDAHSMKGNQEEALKSYHAAIQLRPRYALYHLKAARVYRQQKEWTHAKQHYEKTQALAEDDKIRDEADKALTHIRNRGSHGNTF
jgi:tetratricopeptide (TPR) repeat protein